MLGPTSSRLEPFFFLYIGTSLLSSRALLEINLGDFTYSHNQERNKGFYDWISNLARLFYKQLKDAIREDKHPSLAFLKQRSGLIISGKLESRTHLNHGDCYTNAQTTIYLCHTYPYSNPYKKAKLFLEIPQLIENKFGTKYEVEGQNGPIF